MSGDTILFIIVGLVILYLIFSMMRKQSNLSNDPDNRDYRQRGNEAPRYDDEDVTGRGSFGNNTGRTSSSQQFPWMSDDRRRNQTSSNVGRPQRDSSQVEGRGSFGREKD